MRTQTLPDWNLGVGINDNGVSEYRGGALSVMMVWVQMLKVWPVGAVKCSKGSICSR